MKHSQHRGPTINTQEMLTTVVISQMQMSSRQVATQAWDWRQSQGEGQEDPPRRGEETGGHREECASSVPEKQAEGGHTEYGTPGTASSDKKQAKCRDTESKKRLPSSQGSAGSDAPQGFARTRTECGQREAPEISQWSWG